MIVQIYKYKRERIYCPNSVRLVFLKIPSHNSFFRLFPDISDAEVKMEVKLCDAANVLKISKIKELWERNAKTVTESDSESESETASLPVDVKKRKRRKLGPHLIQNSDDSDHHPFRQAWRSSDEALNDLRRKLMEEQHEKTTSLDFTGIWVCEWNDVQD